jgi:hypothetical protein
MSEDIKNLYKLIGKFPAVKPDLSTPSEFLKRRKILGGAKDIVSGVLGKTPIGRAAKVVVGAGLGVGAAAKGVSDLKDDESFEEGREEGKKEGSDFKTRVKKEIGKKLGQVEGVLNKSKGGSVIARGNKLARSKPTKMF